MLVSYMSYEVFFLALTALVTLCSSLSVILDEQRGREGREKRKVEKK